MQALREAIIANPNVSLYWWFIAFYNKELNTLRLQVSVPTNMDDRMTQHHCLNINLQPVF